MFPSKNYNSIDQYKQIRVYTANKHVNDIDNSDEDKDQQKEVLVWKASISIYDDGDDDKFVSYFKNKDDAVNHVMDKVKKILLDEDLHIDQLILHIESHVLY